MATRWRARANPLTRSIATVASGSAVGSLIAFAVSPVLTRIFTPAAFGTFSVALAVVVVLLSVTTGRIELAVPLPRESGEARDLILIGFLIALLTVCALSLCVWLAPDLARSATPTGLDEYLLAVPVLLVPVASLTLLSAWAIRRSDYRKLASRNILQAAATAVAQLALGLVGLGVWGLLAGYFLGQLVGTIALLYRSHLVEGPRPTVGSLRRALGEYKRYPLILAPTGLVNSLGTQAPVLVVAATYGPAAAGLLALTQRVLTMPVTLVGHATAQVYVGELAKARRSDDRTRLLPLFRSTTRLLAAAGLGLVVLGAPVALFAFGPVFGDAWAAAGGITALMTVGIAAQLVGSSVSQTLAVFNRLWTIALWDLGRLVTTLGALVAAWEMGWTLTQAIAALSAAMLLNYAVYWVLSYRTLLANSPTDESPDDE